MNKKWVLMTLVLVFMINGAVSAIVPEDLDGVSLYLATKWSERIKEWGPSYKPPVFEAWQVAFEQEARTMCARGESSA